MTRKSFWTAGQDSFTTPVSQNPDMFQRLTNAEPVLQGNIQRRRGYSLFTNISPTVPFTNGYSYRNENTLARNLVWTSPSTVVTADEQGNITSNPLFTPSLTAGAVQMVLSRSYGYFADGVAADLVKWDGTFSAGNVSLWGINSFNVAGLPPITDAATAASDVSAPGIVWSNVNNSFTTGSATFATTVLTVPGGTGGVVSDYLYNHTYGFSLPADAVVTGVGVTYQVKDTSNPFTPTIPAPLYVAFLTLDGTTAVSNTNLGIQGAGSNLLTFITFGGPGNLWGLTSITPTQFNSAAFGDFLQAIETTKGHAGSVTASVNSASMTVYYYRSSAAITAAVGGGTGITLLSGRTYFCVPMNPTSGHTGGLNTASNSTGPLTNQNVNLTTIPVFSDPQVSQKAILATADGNDQTTLYLVTILPNATTTYTDSMPDSTLLAQPVFQNTDISGALHGVANNNPPPLIRFPTKHKGRIYGINGPTLFFSKNLDDVTTTTGTITSKWEESWPATYKMDISELAETATGILSDGETLWLASDHNIRRLIGDSPSNFQKPEIEFNEAGLVAQNTWKIVFKEDQPVGTMWLTPDYKVMLSDFNSYKDIGTPIQDVLNTINTAVVQNVAHAAFYSQGPATYYVLHIPTGSNTWPDTLCVYNLKTSRWVIWKPTDQITASLFNFNAGGIPQWLFATQAGSIYRWDSTVLQDRNNFLPTSYPVTSTTSWLDFGDEGLTKAFNKITVTTGDPTLLVGVQGAIRDTVLNSGGTQVIAPTTVQPEIFGDLFVPMVAQPGLYKWYQVTFTSPANTVANVLDAFDFEIAPSLRT